MYKLFTILTLAGLSLASCKKDEETPSNKFAGTWKSTTADMYHNNVFQLTETLDDFVIILNNCASPIGTFCDGSVNEGNSADITSMKYSISEGETYFIIDEDGDVATTEDRIASEIVLINNNQFHIATTYTDTDDNGNNINVKVVTKMTKQ